MQKKNRSNWPNFVCPEQTQTDNMDDFGDFASSEEPAQGFNSVSNTGDDVDPEADFLAREQAAFAAISLNEPLPTSVTSQPTITAPSGLQPAAQDTLFGNFFNHYKLDVLLLLKRCSWR